MRQTSADRLKNFLLAVILPYVRRFFVGFSNTTAAHSPLPKPENVPCGGTSGRFSADPDGSRFAGLSTGNARSGSDCRRQSQTGCLRNLRHDAAPKVRAGYAAVGPSSWSAIALRFGQRLRSVGPGLNAAGKADHGRSVKDRPWRPDGVRSERTRSGAALESGKALGCGRVQQLFRRCNGLSSRRWSGVREQGFALANLRPERSRQRRPGKGACQTGSLKTRCGQTT